MQIYNRFELELLGAVYHLEVLELVILERQKYQKLLKLNNIIEKKFQKNVKEISEKTKKTIFKINSKRNAKRT